MVDMAHTNAFDIFDFKDQVNDNELTTLASMLFQKHALFTTLNINLDKFLTFINKIQAGYNIVPYHNKTHAADVL